MLVHNWEDGHPATYGKLLKAARQIKKQSQARHPASQHPQSDGLSNVWATTSTSLFPLCRLKGNHPAVLGRAMAVKDNEN